MLNNIKSALNANMRGISLISNNIANSNTTAFKKSYSNFSDIYSKNIDDNPRAFSGMGVVNDTPRKQMFQGPLKQTDGALDLAISGLGFLTLASANNFENAYKWYNIATALGIKSAKIKRDEMLENIENQSLFEIQKESINIFNKINNLGG